MNRTIPSLAFLSTILFCSEVVRAQPVPPPPPKAIPRVTARAAAAAEPRWYKGNLHAHSLWSDGNDFPEMVVDWYSRHRYNFVAISEHDVLAEGDRWIGESDAKSRAQRDIMSRCRERFGPEWVEARTENGVTEVRLKPLAEYRTLFERPGHFLVMQGEEITDGTDMKPVHVNATNLSEVIKPRGGRTVAEMLASDLAAVEEQSRRLRRPILAHVNHPNLWYAITAEEMAMVKQVRFFEVYNGHPSVNQPGDREHASVERTWDIVNTLRIAEMKSAPIYGLASDDAHNFTGHGFFTPGRGWIMVRARYLTPESLLKAIEAGEFYASTGVTLKEAHYSPESKTLELEINPRGPARYTTTFIGTRKGYDPARKLVVDEAGKVVPATLSYSDDVGMVLATVEGVRATYQMVGDEYYVRAVVTSDLPPDNPSFNGQKAQAWMPPVGWEKWVQRGDLKSTAK